jgi:hypothetical protein
LGLVGVVNIVGLVFCAGAIKSAMIQHHSF